MATKIKIVGGADATGEVAEAYDYWRASSGRSRNLEVSEFAAGFSEAGG